MSNNHGRSSTYESVEEGSESARRFKRKRTAENRRELNGKENSDGDETRDVHFVGYLGEELSPTKAPPSGSWNVFQTFPDYPTVAIRRPRTEVIASKILQDKLSARELRVRIKEEARIWSILAAAGVAPLIYGMRAFKHSVSKGTEIELITAVPKKYALSVDVYLKGIERPRNEIERICDRVVKLCYGVADLGYCHLDLKFANIVMDIEPLEVRFIDFDPQYMRDIGRDAPLLSVIDQMLSSSTACDVLRLFYVLLMLAWVTLAAEKHANRAGAKSGEANNYALARKCFSRAANDVRGPFVLFFTVPGLADSALMSLATRRMIQYNLGDARSLVAAAPEVSHAQNGLAEASKALKRARTSNAALRIARHRALLRLEQGQRNVLLEPLLSALQRLSSSKLGVEEALQCGGLVFGPTSSSPGTRRSFQSEEYALHCGGAPGVRILTYEAAKPPPLPHRLTLAYHAKLEQEAKSALQVKWTQFLRSPEARF